MATEHAQMSLLVFMVITGTRAAKANCQVCQWPANIFIPENLSFKDSPWQRMSTVFLHLYLCNSGCIRSVRYKSLENQATDSKADRCIILKCEKETWGK